MQFDCSSCHSTLAVPYDFAGFTAPCPYCHQTITAPSLEQWHARDQAPNVKEAVAIPERVEPSVVTRFEREPEPIPIQPREDSIRSKAAARAISQGPRFGTAGPNLPQLLGWGSVTLAMAAGGFAFAVAKFTEPLKSAPRSISLPIDLTAQVLKEKDRVESLKETAMQKAISLVGLVLKSGSAAAAPTRLLSISDTPPVFNPGMFPDINEEDLAVTNCFRKPGTEEYLVTVEPKDGRGPVILIEQQNDKVLIHADALSQQVSESIHAFLSDQASPPLRAYVLARPSQTRHPLAELSGWPKLDIQSPFPTEHPMAFIACAEPAGEAAAAIAKRGEASHWARVVLEFRWAKIGEDKPFIEISRVIPSAWSRF